MLFILLLVYLVFGALVFRAIESKSQTKAQTQLNEYSEEFLRNHSECMNQTDLRDYVTLILDAMEKGAILSKEFGTSNENGGEQMELWNLPNAFFFSSTVVTTIGYGNISPNTVVGRIVCIFYALVGIPLTGWMLSSIGQTFHDRWQSIGKVLRKVTFVTKSSQLNYIVHISVVFLLVYSTIIVIPSLIISYAEDWTYIDSHYFCFISLTTIGFGDLAPQTWRDADGEFKKWIQTSLYVTYLLLGLSLLSVALTAFLRKNQGKLKNAGKRMKRFVANSARSATVKMKEAKERGQSVGSTPEGSFKHGNSTEPSSEPKLLKVVARLTSMEESKKRNFQPAPWQIQSEYEKALAQESEHKGKAQEAGIADGKQRTEGEANSDISEGGRGQSGTRGETLPSSEI